MASQTRMPASRRRNPTEKPALVLASLQRRVAGAAIDMALLVVAAGLLSAMFESWTAGITRVRIDAESGQRSVHAAISLPEWLPLALLVGLTAAYTIVLMTLWGRTIGGWAVGIRCVHADSGQRPTWIMSTRRWFALYGAAGLLAFAPVIGPFTWVLTLVVGLSPLWDGSRRLRGYADHLGQDVVVMARGVPARA